MTDPTGRDSFDKLAWEVCVEFARFAKLPEEAGVEFLNVPFLWIAHALRDDTYLRGLLSDVKHRAADLHRQLEKVQRHLERAAPRFKRNDRRYYDLDFAALKSLPATKIAHATKVLSALAETPIMGFQTPERGRPRGIKSYPGLEVLVWNLEFNAQCAGGGFTVHRKAGEKGSLVDVLDRLRDRLLASSDLKHLADRLPSRGKHPIAIYERALKLARKSAAVGRQ